MKRTELVKLLELAQPALSSTNLIPVYTCFMFKPKSVSAYNDTIGIIAKGGVGADPFATSGMTLLGLLQNSQADEVDFDLTKESLVVKSGKSTFKLPYFKEDEFLFTEPKEKWSATAVIAEDLIKGIEVCLSTASSDQAKPAYLGVCLDFNTKGKLTLFSTDGDAITRYRSNTDAGGKGVFVAPTAFCDALLKICHETETTQGELMVNGDWAAAILNNGFRIYGRMIVNDKPLDYQGVMDDTLKGKQPFVDLPLGFGDALARARVLADPESAKTVMTVEAGKLQLLTETHMGNVRDQLRVKGHNDVEAAVHASLVQRSIQACDQISIRENCTAYQKDDVILQVVANIGV